MRAIADLLDFETPDLRNIFEGIISKELIYLGNFSSVVKLAESAYQMQLPYPTFWKGLANVLLLSYPEMEFSHVVQLLYYLGKAGHRYLELEPALLGEKIKVSKVQKTASHQLLMAYVED